MDVATTTFAKSADEAVGTDDEATRGTRAKNAAVRSSMQLPLIFATVLL